MRLLLTMIHKKTAIVLIILTILLTSSSTWAHHPAAASGTGRAGPITTTSATTLQEGEWALELQTEHIKFDTFSDSELSRFAARGNDVHTFDFLLHYFFSLSYGITNNFTLGLKLPYVSLNNIREVHETDPADIHARGDSKGLGDLAILGYYRFFKTTDADFESTLMFGLKVPTGYTNDKDIHGERFETDHQPGSGSWDPMAGIAATKRFGRLSLDASVLYTLATAGAQNTDLGDMLHYNIALSYRVLKKYPSWDLILEANGEWKQKQTIDGVKDENSGGNVLLLSSGMRFTFNNQWSAYLSVGFPVIQDLNGIQPDTSFRGVVGISVGF